MSSYHFSTEITVATDRVMDALIQNEIIIATAAARIVRQGGDTEQAIQRQLGAWSDVIGRTGRVEQVLRTLVDYFGAKA